MPRGTGSTPFSNGALVGTAVLAKTGRVSLSGFFVYNPSNAAAYVRVYDAAAAADVTNGTTVPDYVIGSNTLTWAQGTFCRPIQFTKGMVILACTTAVGSGTTAPNVGLVLFVALSD